MSDDPVKKTALSLLVRGAKEFLKRFFKRKSQSEKPSPSPLTVQPSEKNPTSLALLVCFLLSSIVFSKESPGKRYPDRLITPDYGIVTEDDLAYDAARRGSQPYDPSDFSGCLYWQCLPIENVSPHYRTWRDSDPLGSSNIIVTMCDLEIKVHHEGEVQHYVGRRARQVGYCREFMKNWQRVTKGEKIVCLDGESGNYHEDKDKGKYRLWTWDKIKTKKGCFSYFGDCNVAGYVKKEKTN